MYFSNKNNIILQYCVHNNKFMVLRNKEKIQQTTEITKKVIPHVDMKPLNFFLGNLEIIRGLQHSLCQHVDCRYKIK